MDQSTISTLQSQGGALSSATSAARNAAASEIFDALSTIECEHAKGFLAGLMLRMSLHYATSPEMRNAAQHEREEIGGAISGLVSFFTVYQDKLRLPLNVKEGKAMKIVGEDVVMSIGDLYLTSQNLVPGEQPTASADYNLAHKFNSVEAQALRRVLKEKGYEPILHTIPRYEQVEEYILVRETGVYLRAFDDGPDGGYCVAFSSEREDAKAFCKADAGWVQQVLAENLGIFVDVQPARGGQP